jgi:release factor glutamine methyltransferase
MQCKDCTVIKTSNEIIPPMIDWYEPDEDSYTLLDVLAAEDIKGKVVVDLGCSTGFLAQGLAGNIVVSADLNMKALLNHAGRNLVRADLLAPINQQMVDVVVFNPPYVPDTEDPVIGGGKYGRRIIDRFIAAVDVCTFYLLVIEANRPLEVVELLKQRGYEVEVCRVRRILGETIYILKGHRTSDPSA